MDVKKSGLKIGTGSADFFFTYVYEQKSLWGYKLRNRDNKRQVNLYFLTIYFEHFLFHLQSKLDMKMILRVRKKMFMTK